MKEDLDRTHVGAHGARQRTQTANATEATKQLAADRAINDPVKLARAARIVRTALACGRLNLADLGVDPTSPRENVVPTV